MDKLRDMAVQSHGSITEPANIRVRVRVRVRVRFRVRCRFRARI